MKILNKVLILSLCIVTFSGTAFAQACSLADQVVLKTCVDATVESCRLASSACNKFEPVLTINDVRTLAIENCCAKTKKSARNLCLKREKQKYATKVGSGSQRIFFKEARNNINDVKKNICKNSSYTLPADSSLF